MKKRLVFLIPLMLSLILTGPAMAGYSHIEHDNFSLDFEGDTLVVKNGHRHQDIVEIAADLSLSVNGTEIQTDRKDRKLLKAYYENAEGIEEVARELGMEGARLGIQGAALGVKAISKVMALFASDYDAEDLEAEIEAEAEKIEIEAEGLEEAAEVLEERVEELAEIGDRLQERIPELAELDWF